MVSAPSSLGTAPRTGTELALVNVIADGQTEALRAQHLLTDLRKEDFRIFDNGKEVPVASFDTGLGRTARPIALWLIVQCHMDFLKDYGSQFLRGHGDVLAPALLRLRPEDTVGVAHWCDTGSSALDLQPGHSVPMALEKVNGILEAPVQRGGDRDGEIALQHMMHNILNAANSAQPQPFPVLLFLYGDHSAAYPPELEPIVMDLLGHSGIVFGINNESSGMDVKKNLGVVGQISFVIHSFSSDTGGNFYGVQRPELFGSALDYVLAQVHLRYVLGFTPLVMDGKRHTLRVELTKEAKRRYNSTQLRYRQEYIPVLRGDLVTATRTPTSVSHQ